MLRRRAKSAEGSEARLLRNTAVNALGSSIGVLVTLLLTPLLIRRLGSEAYGVWIEKTSYGRKHMGIERSTFLIDADGNVAKAMRGIRPAGHAAEVLSALPSR